MESKHVGDFYVSDITRRLIHLWWLLPAFMIAGGIFGFLLSRLQKPIYESTAQVTTVIDYAYAGRLTDAEEDHLVNAVGDVIFSDRVMIAVQNQAVANGLLDSLAAVKSSLALSRQGYRWELSCRAVDPQTAQSINQIWVTEALSALQEARQDSIVALSQFAVQEEIEACFAQSVVLEPSSPYCSVEEMEALQQSLVQVNYKTAEQSLLSRLLLSRISYQITREASLPQAPTQNSINLNTAAGFIAGLIVALMLLIFGSSSTRQRN